jgi:hypothetical protein
MIHPDNKRHGWARTAIIAGAWHVLRNTDIVDRYAAGLYFNDSSTCFIFGFAIFRVLN